MIISYFVFIQVLIYLANNTKRETHNHHSEIETYADFQLWFTKCKINNRINKMLKNSTLFITWSNTKISDSKNRALLLNFQVGV